MTNETDRNTFPEFGLPRGGQGDRLPNGKERPLTAREREIAARRAAIRDVPIEQMNPRRQ